MKCKCGRDLKWFMHNCPNTNTYSEVHGCPFCDDECGHCKEVSNV